MNRAYLPSRKILALIIVILAITAILYIIFAGSQGTGRVVSSEEKAALQEADADNDGLSDWQESLWGTDVENPDSDGDGTEDGAEVAADRDPNKPAPDDKLAKTEVSASSSGPNLTTQAESRLLPSGLALAAARRNGEEITQEELDRITDSVSADVESEARTYDRTSLTIANGGVTAQVYSQNLINALTVSQSGSQRTPLEIIAVALENGEKKRVDLSPYIKINETVISRLRNVSVPRAYTSTHLEILNNVEKKRASLSMLETVATDPVKGIIAIRDYKESLQNIDEAVTDMATALNQNL